MVNSIDTCIRKVFLLALCLIMPIRAIGMQEMPEWAEHMVEEGFTACLAGIVVVPVMPKSYFLMGLGIAGALPVMYAMGKKISYEDMIVKLGEVASKTKAGIELLLHNFNQIDVPDKIETPFFEYAVKSGLLEDVECMLLSSNNHTRKWKSSTVCNAVKCFQSKEMVALLAQYGAELQYQELAFYESIKKGDARTVQLFLDAGVAINKRAFKSPEWTAVDVAAHYGHMDVTQLLLSAGAQPNPSIGLYVQNSVAIYLLEKHRVLKENGGGEFVGVRQGCGGM